ncbi:MAG TPA: TonB family protein [Vicinamibacteria bacterium]|nr:TonB family protein [Vicinamibacteria bacterium]
MPKPDKESTGPLERALDLQLVQDPLPTAFGRYEVQGLVGEGSMGRVYRAYDPMAKRVVAIKTLKTEYLSGTRGEEYLKRFRREAQAAGNLAHPHITTVFDVGDDFFVMELLEGVTLHRRLQQVGQLELAEALQILGPIAEGLDYAHSKGTIHRDIKPSNIMILPDGRPKIMDFGVAHLTSTAVTAAGDFVGSPSYMAPEQITSSQASARTDLFSLAVVAYETLTGKRCFEGESIAQIVHNVVNADPPPPSSHNPALPPRFDEVFRRSLAKDPSTRFPSGASFVAALGRRSGDAAGPAATPVAPVPSADGADAAGVVATHDLKEVEWKVPGPATASSAWSFSHRNSLLALGALVLSAVAATVALRRSAALQPSAQGRSSVPTGGLEIATEPVGAQVWVDSAEAGKSPLSLAGVRPGRHAIRVALPGFSSAELALDVPAGAFGVPLRFTLQPVSAVLEVHSDPEGAEVVIDGQPRGTTPLEGLSLRPGEHGVQLTRNGFAPWVQTVQARAGDRIPLLGRLQGQPSADLSEHLRSLGWVREGDFLEPGPDVTPPRKISGETAPYPEPARRLKLGGMVAIEMTVTVAGEPAELRVVESAGEVLDDAVLAAVRNWRYAPAQKNGVKVRTRVRVEQTFSGKGALNSSGLLPSKLRAVLRETEKDAPRGDAEHP